MFQILAQNVLNTLQLGSVYALIALGYTMVYGILTMINFAHGDIFMVGTYLCLAGASFLLGLPLGLPMVVVFTGALDRQKVRDALAAVDEFEGVTGNMKFRNMNDPVKSAVILQIKDGKFKYFSSVQP